MQKVLTVGSARGALGHRGGVHPLFRTRGQANPGVAPVPTLLRVGSRISGAWRTQGRGQEPRHVHGVGLILHGKELFRVADHNPTTRRAVPCIAPAFQMRRAALVISSSEGGGSSPSDGPCPTRSYGSRRPRLESAASCAVARFLAAK